MIEVTNWVDGHQVHVFYLLLALSLLFNRLPIIGVFFRTVNTLMHESGHAVGAILTRGEVVRIDILHDTSGIAKTTSNSKVSAFLVSFAGYPFAALASSILLVISIKGLHELGMLILFSVIIINLLLFVRNLFGIVWLILFLSLLALTVYLKIEMLSNLFLLFVCMIAFTESFASTIIVATLGITNPKKSGDLYNMQRTSGIPAIMWAMVIFTLVMWVLYYTVSHYFPDPGQLVILEQWK